MMIKINLLSPKTDSPRSRAANVTALCILVTSAISFIVLLCWFFFLQIEIEKCSTVRSKLKEESRELDRIEALIVQNQQDLQDLDKRSASLEQIRHDRLAPNQVLGAVTDSLPHEPKMFLTRLAQVEHKVHLSGKSTDLKTMTDCISQLENSSIFELVSLNRWETQREVFYFEILCLLKE